MELILIYGPPATGKHTIAKELVKKLGYELLHNHAVIDTAMSIMDSSKKSFWDFCWKLRFELVRESVNGKIKGIVMTMAFAGNKSEIKNMRKIASFVGKKGGKVRAVKLTCDFDELKKRVSSKSRLKYGKVRDVKALKAWFKNYKDVEILPKKALTVDTTKLSPKKSAEKILNLFQVPF